MGNGCSYKCTNSDCGYEAMISGGLVAPAPDLKPIQPKCGECEGTNLRKFFYGRTRCPKCRAKLKRDADSGYEWD